MFMIDLDGSSPYTLLGVAPTATIAEIRTARDELINRLRTEARGESDPARKEELEEKQRRINAAADPLVRPARREEFDREHPELRTLTVRSAAAPFFTDPAHRTDVLYRVLFEHLTARGARLHPSSDLYRTGFTADETPNQLLDDLLDDLTAQRRP